MADRTNFPYPGNPGFESMAEQAANKIYWIMTTDGELLTTPAPEG
jgi:hypothetical protein